MKKHRSIKSHICGRMYVIADKLPSSQSRFGRLYKALRNRIAKGFIASCGNNVNLEPHIRFNLALQIGDYSGIGEHSEVYGDVRIGKYVMMGTGVKIYSNPKTTLSPARIYRCASKASRRSNRSSLKTMFGLEEV